jgi:molecular chaperone DnaJ
MATDHYETLGIDRDATQRDITAAYRRIAVQTHPDKLKDLDEESRKQKEDEFRAASEAYEILSNIERREAYDHRFDKPAPKKTQRKGTNLRVTISARTEDLAKSTSKKIRINRKGFCPDCKGTGSREKKSETCSACNGGGIDPLTMIVGPKEKCKKCGGVGQLPVGEKCKKCSGTGIYPEVIERSVRLNPFTTGSILVPGAGNCISHGIAGDLMVELEVEKDPVYTLERLDIWRKLDISPALAVLGGPIELYVFGRRVEVQIPPGTQNQHLLEVEGEGVRYGKKRGNLNLRLQLNIPTVVTEEQHELYRQLLATEEGACQKVSRVSL